MPDAPGVPLTNGERIRSMDDEELADYLVERDDGVFCANLEICEKDLCADVDIPDERCRGCALKWLQSEVEA